MCGVNKRLATYAVASLSEDEGLDGEGEVGANPDGVLAMLLAELVGRVGRVTEALAPVGLNAVDNDAVELGYAHFSIPLFELFAAFCL